LLIGAPEGGPIAINTRVHDFHCGSQALTQQPSVGCRDHGISRFHRLLRSPRTMRRPHIKNMLMNEVDRWFSGIHRAQR
jgi:hypothetical protein